VDAWWQLHRRYGKLKWAELFEPAIAYAEGGVPLSPVVAYYMNRAMANYARPNMGIEEIANAQATFASGDRARAGEIFRNPDLARTYRAIAAGGRDVFYEGEIARTIEAYFKRHRRLDDARRLGRASERVDPALLDKLPRRRRPCDRRQHAGARHPADAEHPRAVRHEGRGLPDAAVDPPPGRGQAPRL
jgi:gamma-glutamyltranspeptidase/glutathione hydrolase